MSPRNRERVSPCSSLEVKTLFWLLPSTGSSGSQNSSRSYLLPLLPGVALAACSRRLFSPATLLALEPVSCSPPPSFESGSVALPPPTPSYSLLPLPPTALPSPLSFALLDSAPHLKFTSLYLLAASPRSARALSSEATPLCHGSVTALSPHSVTQGAAHSSFSHLSL